MEELQGSRLARRTPNGEARSACGGGARSASSAASSIADYAEIFGGFAASCSIPVLVLPEAMDGYGQALAGSQSSGLNYLEIFGALDGGTFSLSYEELLSMAKGPKEEDEEDDDRFQEQKDVNQVEIGASELPAEVPIGGHITFSEVNQISSSFHPNFDKEQLNFSGRVSEQSIVDEVNSTMRISGPLANCGPDFEAEAVSATEFVERDSSRNIASDDMEEEKDAGEQRKILNEFCVVNTVDSSENDMKDAHKNSSKGAAYDLKQHSRSSSYHSTSSGDIPFSDYAFLTISDINLRTQPLQVPPPSRAPPKLDMKQGMPKPETLEASNAPFNKEIILEASKSYQAHHIGGPRTRHALKETVKSNSPVYSNVEVDASRAAAASAAAMIEAMEQAQVSLKCAKELMERKRDSPQSDRRLGPHDFGTWNGQNINFAGESKHKAKMAQKAVPYQEERVTSVLSEDAEEVIQGKESRSYQLSDENERSHEWKIDKQFYELVSSEKLIRTRVIDDEKYDSNEDVKLVHLLNAYQYIPGKESCGKQEQRFLHGNDDNEDVNKVEKLSKYRINEKKLFSGGEFQLLDVNAKKMKSGIIIDKEEIMKIFERSGMPCLQGDDAYKQKMGPTLQVPNDEKKKIQDTISLIQHDRDVNELKEYQESCICAEDKSNADGNTEPNACWRNGSGLTAFCRDSKLEEFDGGQDLGETLVQGKETHLYTSNVKKISEPSVVFEYDAFMSDECMAHSWKVDSPNITSEFGINKKVTEAKLFSLQNANEFGVDTEYRTSFSFEKEKNMEATKEECQFGKLNLTTKETYIMSYNEGDSELEGIDNNTSEQENRSFSDIDKTSAPEKNEKKLKHKPRAKWNIPNRSELKVAKLSVEPVCLEKANEALGFWQNEEKMVYELPQKIDNYEDKLTADGERRKDEKQILGKVKAALELEKKFMGMSAAQQVFQTIRVQNSEAVQQANSLDNRCNILCPSVDASGSSWKQMEKGIPDEWRDASNISNEILDSERKQEAEQKRKLEEKERTREREKDRIAVEKATLEAYERVFAESRERPENIAFERVAAEARHRPIAAYRDITVKSSAEALERSENVANEAKLRAERAAVERATIEARERAIERALAEQASLGARRQADASVNISKDKNWKHNEAEDIVRPDDKDSDNSLKPTSDVHDAPIDKKSRSAGCEGESPLRCKARQQRCQRIVERTAKALAEKNMRDLHIQREQEERNRLAESLGTEVRRWSSGKEGNLRALLSTLQYILGHDSGWQPIPLTEVITAAAVRKAYRKATLYVHPDKLQQRGASIQHKYICEKVFDLLKDAWNKFNSEGS